MKRRSIAFLAGGLLALAAFGAAAEGPLEDGRNIYNGADYLAEAPNWFPFSPPSPFENCRYYRAIPDYLNCVTEEINEDGRVVIGNIQAVVRSPKTASSNQWSTVIFIVSVLFALLVYNHMNYNKW